MFFPLTWHCNKLKPINMIVAVWLGHNNWGGKKGAHDGIPTSKQGIVTPEFSLSTIKVTST